MKFRIQGAEESRVQVRGVKENARFYHAGGMMNGDLRAFTGTPES
jgi:hypothetical protein